MTGPGPGSRRLGQTRSSKEYGKTVYTCTGLGTHDRPHVLEPVAPGMLRCPVCGVTKPIGYKRRRLIADAGLTEVDISALPF